MRRFAGCFAACLITSPVLAHPGHGVTEGDSAVHYLAEPLHIGPVILLVVAGIATALWLKRRNKSLRHERVRKH
ncbi:hypothetical protein AYO47_02390 [Planctomyces sp. SCGC AG-212-M04]|nr:hypothetical protein AYO47_02390 [Planctomyces sp. SCGC AG-212-M04]